MANIGRFDFVKLRQDNINKESKFLVAPEIRYRRRGKGWGALLLVIT
jgi:hypothetical protein